MSALVNGNGAVRLRRGARRYDPSLGRFVQADSVVPLASQGVQALDRYAYANNNPVRYNDPSGHCIACGDGGDTGACGGEDAEYRYWKQQLYYKDLTYSTKKGIVDSIVPDKGTIGIGFSGTVGAALYITGSIGFHIDSHGNLAAFSPSIGGGTLLPAAGEGAFFISMTNAEYITQMEGLSMVIGGSLEIGGSVGGDNVIFKDPSTGQKFNGGTATFGLGQGAPVPAEGHVGVNYTWIPIMVNIFDLVGLPRR